MFSRSAREAARLLHASLADRTRTAFVVAIRLWRLGDSSSAGVPVRPHTMGRQSLPHPDPEGPAFYLTGTACLLGRPKGAVSVVPIVLVVRPALVLPIPEMQPAASEPRVEPSERSSPGTCPASDSASLSRS